MYRLFFFTLAICFYSAVSAQNCSEAELLNTPGKWIPGMKGSVSGISAKDLPKQQSVVNEIIPMVQKKYSPRGLNVSFGGAYQPPFIYSPNGIRLGNSYYAYFYLLPLYCDASGAIKQAHETPSSLSIIINDGSYPSSFFVPSNIDEEDPETDVFATIDHKPVYTNGYWLMKDTFTGGFQKQITNIRYYITKDNQLPFVYMSKKEYAEKLKRYYQKKIQQVVNNAKRAREDQKEIMEENIAQANSFYGNSIKNIDEFLQTASASEFEEPATIVGGGPSSTFEGFPKENDYYKSWIIKPNPGYYDPKLPLSTPQLIVLNFKIHEASPVFVNAMQDLLKAIDFKQLQLKLGNTASSTQKTTNPAPPRVSNTNIVSITTSKNTFNPFLNEPTKGFVPTPVSQIKNAVVMPAVNQTIKTAALNISMTTANRQEILKKLLYDIQKQLSPAQLQETEKWLRSVNNNAIELADLGVMLYYKGMVAESFWCLAQAASFKPDNDYILNNLTGILNLGGAAPRSLPILRYLAKKYPTNSTVLNNLGQAWFAMGEWERSKSVLDSCLRISPNHPQANYTRAAIAEKESKNAEAAAYIQKSLKGAYNNETENLARKKSIKIDWANSINRNHPTDAAYISPLKFIPPPQCTNVLLAAETEGRWKAWAEAVGQVLNQINGGLAEASTNYEKALSAFEKNKQMAPAIPNGIMQQKAAILYKIYLDKYAVIMRDANEYLQIKYEKEKASFEADLEAAHERIQKKYAAMSGEGKGDFSGQQCSEINQASNLYLQKMAALNNNFNNRFSEPARMLQIELMYWSLLLPEPQHLREMKYYQHAMFAVQPLQMPSEIVYPCGVDENPVKSTHETDEVMPYCPISFKFKIKFVKVTGDCGKFELELEAGGLVGGFERDFINKKSTIAFGVGASLDLENKDAGGISQNVKVPGIIPEFVDISGGGVGVKLQGFVEIGPNGVISDGGIRMEGSIEGPLTDKGDIKIGGKMGVNSGVQVTTSQAVDDIAQNINELITTPK